MPSLGRVLPTRHHPGLVTLGDGNTALSWLSRRSRDQWPERVGRQLGLVVRNLGRDGCTISDAYDQGIVQKALTSGARFVTVGFAAADCARLSLSQHTGLLDRLLDDTRSTTVTPVLLTGVWLDPALDATGRSQELEVFNDAIRSAASHHGVRLADVAERMEKETAKGHGDLLRMPDADHDEVHLNAAGSRLVAHLVVQALRLPDSHVARSSGQESATHAG